MEPIAEDVSRFLSAVAREVKSLPEPLTSSYARPFVTISRQAGAGGHALAGTILRRMDQVRGSPLFQGWQLLDRQIIDMVAANPRLRVSAAWMLEKEYRTDIEDTLASVFAGVSPQSEVMAEVFGIMRGLAARGKVILLGRGGASLTRGYPGGVHIRLVSALPNRVERLARLLNISTEKAGTMADEQDRARRQLVRHYFNADVEDPAGYDAVWNTDTVSLDVIASTVVRFIEYKYVEGEKGGRRPARDVLRSGSEV